jgi:hypothetical protein
MYHINSQVVEVLKQKPEWERMLFSVVEEGLPRVVLPSIEAGVSSKTFAEDKVPQELFRVIAALVQDR